MENSIEMIVGAKAIAAATGFSPRMVYELVDSGELPVMKVGKRVAIRKSRLADWVSDLEAKGNTSKRMEREGKSGKAIQ